MKVNEFEALQNDPHPKNAKEVRAYVALLNYFWAFIPSSAEEVRPLYALLKKDVKFQWSVECDEAFNKTNVLLTQDSYLKTLYLSKDTLLLCYASPVGISAVLMQQEDDGMELPLRYYGTKSKAAKLCTIAIKYGLKRFYQYFYGRTFTIVTDAQRIKGMFHPEKAAARIQRWGVYLTQFNFDIIHRPSTKMCVPDLITNDLPILFDNMLRVKSRTRSFRS